MFAAFGMEDLTVTNNTILDFKGRVPQFLLFDSTRNGSHAGLLVSENIFTAEPATVASVSGGNAGAAALDLQWTAYPDPKWTFENNVICCDVKRQVDSPNMWPQAISDLGLGGFLGSQPASDSPFFKVKGSDDTIGVNLDQLQAALSGNIVYLRGLP